MKRLLDMCARALGASRFVVLLYLFSAASVSLNVSLAYKLRSLAKLEAAKIADQLLKVGSTVPEFTAQRLGGLKEVISYQNTAQPTVLYVFTPPCSWCARNLDNFKTLANKESAQYRFVGVSLSPQGLVEYAAKNDLKVPIYFGLSSETLRAYKLGGTPQTLVVSPDGRVLQDWIGAYVGDQKSQVEAFFHVGLPGLKELPKAEAAAKN